MGELSVDAASAASVRWEPGPSVRSAAPEEPGKGLPGKGAGTVRWELDIDSYFQGSPPPPPSFYLFSSALPLSPHISLLLGARPLLLSLPCKAMVGWLLPSHASPGNVGFRSAWRNGGWEKMG